MRLNSGGLRFAVVRLAKLKVALRVGSCAAKTYKPRQVRKEAAVVILRVPQGAWLELTSTWALGIVNRNPVHGHAFIK